MPVVSNIVCFVLTFFFVPELLYCFYNKLSRTFLNEVNFKLSISSIYISLYYHLGKHESDF